ncbi:hypothetical protein L249_7910 [Ophiocordyceps polyrhachis-furcata BCC 54312]|uniref:Uncharacterized protein n=1 Tax=Ophiocordyceps polyrhachis-furcata BCC 54312 TaxID=1330021 RepID=A0A367LI52_9HYPO|nr:hypothetical protein L249_7910 [Ophiocordyceps polyrhachis-furcata BCC 54312]
MEQCKHTKRLRKLVNDDRYPPSDRQKRPHRDDGQSQAPKRPRFTYGRRRPTSFSGVEPPYATVTTPPRFVRPWGAPIDPGNSSPTSVPFDMTTPVWRKIREQPDTPICVDTSPSRAAQSERDLYDWRHEINCLRSTVSEERFRTYEAIFFSLDGLLRSTASGAQEPHRRSLLSICLRNIPACIANIEAYDMYIAKVNGRRSMWDVSHVSSDLYEQLEALGSSNSGWRPMKLALRAHAIWQLSESVKEGLLEPKFVRLLIKLCLRLEFREEAGQLCSCVTAALPAPRSALSSMAENQQLLPLHEILKSIEGERPPGAALLSASSLASRGLLPVSWLSAQAFSALWKLSLEFITIRNMGPVLITHWPVDREKVFIRFIAGAVVAATTETTSRGVGREQRRRRGWRRVQYLLELCLAELRYQKGLRRRQHPSYDEGQFIILLARYLVATDSPFSDLTFQLQSKAELSQLAQGTNGKAASQRYCHQAATILARIAHYRSRSSAVPGREVVADLCAKLDNLGLGGYFGRGLRTDVAFLLAQQTKDLRDLAFAESLPSAGADGYVSTVFPGWHWEEGISEWVLPTHEGNSAVNNAVDGTSRQVTDSSVCLNRRHSRKTKNSRNKFAPGNAPGLGQSKFPSSTSQVRRKSLKLLRPSPSGDDRDDLI